MDQKSHHNPYYYSDRDIYSNKETVEKEVKEHRKKPKMSPCEWILLILLIIFAVLLVIFLLIFLTWGYAYAKPPELIVARSEISQNGHLSSDSDQLISPADINGALPPHFDLNLPPYVLNAFRNRNPKICVLDTAYDFNNANYDGRQKYAEEHIPESKHFDISRIAKFSTADSGQVQFAHPLEFQDYVRSLGVDNDCHVILYDHSDQRTSILSATFVWWLFKLYDHHRVTVLNGGLNYWKKFTSNDPYYKVVSGSDQNRQIQRGDFVAGWNPKWVATFQDVLQYVKSPSRQRQLVDSRKQDEFLGTSKSPDAQGYGRIRGALNVFTENLLNEDGALKPFKELQDLLKIKNLLESSNRPLSLVVYDNYSFMGSAVHFVLVQFGYDARLYDAGWVEFSRQAPSEYRERTNQLSS